MKGNEKELEKILKAIANHRRILILRYLKRSKSASVGKIAQEIKLSFKATSRHLSVLYRSGIIDREQVSLNINYFLATRTSSIIKRILDLL